MQHIHEFNLDGGPCSICGETIAELIDDYFAKLGLDYDTTEFATIEKSLRYERNI